MTSDRPEWVDIIHIELINRLNCLEEKIDRIEEKVDRQDWNSIRLYMGATSISFILAGAGIAFSGFPSDIPVTTIVGLYFTGVGFGLAVLVSIWLRIKKRSSVAL